MYGNDINAAADGFRDWVRAFNPDADDERTARNMAEPLMYNYMDMMARGFSQEDAMFATVATVNYYARATLPFKGLMTAMKIIRSMDESINGTDKRGPTKTIEDYESRTNPNGKPKKDTEFRCDQIMVRIWDEFNRSEDIDEQALDSLGVEYLHAYLRHGHATNSNRIPIIRLVGTELVPKNPADPDGEKTPYYQTVEEDIIAGRLSLEGYMAMLEPHADEIIAGIMVRLGLNGEGYFKEGAMPVDKVNGAWTPVPCYDMRESCADRLMSLGAEPWTLPLIAIADYAREGTEFLGETDVSNMYRRLFNRNANGTPWKGNPRYDLRSNLVVLNRIMTGISYRYDEEEIVEILENDEYFKLDEVSAMTATTIAYYGLD